MNKSQSQNQLQKKKSSKQIKKSKVNFKESSKEKNEEESKKNTPQKAVNFAKEWVEDKLKVSTYDEVHALIGTEFKIKKARAPYYNALQRIHDGLTAINVPTKKKLAELSKVSIIIFSTTVLNLDGAYSTVITNISAIKKVPS